MSMQHAAPYFVFLDAIIFYFAIKSFQVVTQWPFAAHNVCYESCRWLKGPKIKTQNRSSNGVVDRIELTQRFKVSTQEGVAPVQNTFGHLTWTTPSIVHAISYLLLSQYISYNVTLSPLVKTLTLQHHTNCPIDQGGKTPVISSHLPLQFILLLPKGMTIYKQCF